jgi:hypothetical protein
MVQCHAHVAPPTSIGAARAARRPDGKARRPGLHRRPKAGGSRRRHTSIGAVLLASTALFGACHSPLGKLTARASDEWTRVYPLSEGGEVQITNDNGTVTVEGVDGSMVDVRAERIVQAATDAAARELLPRISIKEEIDSSRVAIGTERLSGLLIGVRVEVKYHVRVPKTALVRLRMANGDITASELDGRLVASTSNGGITGRNLAGGVEARAVNGPVTIDIRSVGDELIELRTVNGQLTLTLPATARANLSATCTNGVIDTSALALDLMGEQTRRRVRGRLNGGGTPIELSTTNGPIRVAVR